jgi:hypothetical protein
MYQPSLLPLALCSLTRLYPCIVLGALQIILSQRDYIQGQNRDVLPGDNQTAGLSSDQDQAPPSALRCGNVNRIWRVPEDYIRGVPTWDRPKQPLDSGCLHYQSSSKFARCFCCKFNFGAARRLEAYHPIRTKLTGESWGVPHLVLGSRQHPPLVY